MPLTFMSDRSNILFFVGSTINLFYEALDTQMDMIAISLFCVGLAIGSFKMGYFSGLDSKERQESRKFSENLKLKLEERKKCLQILDFIEAPQKTELLYPQITLSSPYSIRWKAYLFL